MKLIRLLVLASLVLAGSETTTFAGSPTALQWGVDRTASPWSACAYDSTNTCQSVFSLPSTGGGAFVPPVNGGVHGLTGVLYGNGNSAATAIPSGNLPNVANVYNVLALTSAGVPQWGYATCGASNCAVGTGGDDSAPINAAIAAAAASAASSGLVFLPPPPSGAYNVCASYITRPTSAYNSITLMGPASGGSTIRIKPGCSSGIQEVIYDPPIAFTSPATASAVRFALENLRIDSYCLAPHTLWSGFSPGFVSHNVVYRNAAGGYDASGIPSSNIYIAGAYEGSIDATNRIENVNDTGHICYTNPVDFPAYNLYTIADDWQISVPAVGAEIANYAAINGGGNIFTNAHGWGYASGNADSQTVSQPLYTAVSRGYQLFSNLLADSPVIAGIRPQIVPGSGGVSLVNGIVSAGTSTSLNTKVTCVGTTGTGTKFQAIGYTNASGGLGGAFWVFGNGNYSVLPSNPSNEPVSCTPTVTGASLSIVDGTGYQNTDGPQVNGIVMEGALAGSTYGVSLGVAVQRLSLTNGQFEYLADNTKCLSLDISPISIDSTVFNNVNCGYTQVPYGINIPNSQGIDGVNASGNYGQIFTPSSSNDLYFGDIQGVFNGSVRIRSSGGDALIINSSKQVSLTTVPTSAGTGGLYVCIDTSGNLYKKSSCP